MTEPRLPRGLFFAEAKSRVWVIGSKQRFCPSSFRGLFFKKPWQATSYFGTLGLRVVFEKFNMVALVIDSQGIVYSPFSTSWYDILLVIVVSRRLTATPHQNEL